MMYVFQNALKNIGRNKGRNVLLALIIFAIIATTVVTLMIYNTSTAVIESYKERFSSEVSITPDMQKLMENAQRNAGGGPIAFRRPDLAPELQLAFAQSEALKESIATASVPADSNSLFAVDQAEEEEEEENGPQISGGGSVMMVGRVGNYNILGDNYEGFNNASRELQDGGRLPDDGECIISSELAELNNISVGDNITFQVTFDIEIPEEMDLSGKEAGDTILINDTEYTLEESALMRMTSGGREQPEEDLPVNFSAKRYVDLTLTVSGIYNDYTDEYPNEMISNIPFLNNRNEILTTLGTLLDLRKTNETGVTVSINYYLKNPDLLSDFEAEIRSMGLPDEYIVTTDDTSYKTIVAPVEGIKGICLTFMIVVIIMGAIILLLLSSISIRERKYEIGVLRAMGMKKNKVAAGLLFEIVTITCICMVIGVIAGGIAAQPVSDILLESQIQAEEQSGQMSGMPNTGGRGNFVGMPMQINSGRITNASAANVQPLSEMDITIGLNTILQIFGIAIGLAAVAGIFSVTKITKYEPIKILTERN